MDQRAIAAVAGTWVYYAGASDPGIGYRGSTARGYEESVTFDGKGNFKWQSSSYVDVDSRVTGGGYSTGFSSGSSDSDYGTYSVIGQSLIIIR